MPKTSSGRRLINRGFEGCAADWVIHVCFDSYYFEHYKVSAPCMFFYKPKIAARLASESKGVYGSRIGSSEKRTGYGAKIEPHKLGAQVETFIPSSNFSSLSLGDKGVAEVKRFYENSGWEIRLANKHEQISEKIDLVATRSGVTLKLEVKARGEDKSFPALFIQTHESNPDKRIS